MPRHELDPVDRLAVAAVSLPPDGVGGARPGHEVSFVARVDELPGGHHQVRRARGRRRVLQRDRADPGALLRHALQLAGVQHVHARLVDVLLEHLLGGVGFERPCLELAIVAAEPAVEVEPEAGDGVLVPDVGVAQPPGAQPAQMSPRLDQEHALPVALCRISRDDPRRRAAVNEHVQVEGLRLGAVRAHGHRYREHPRRHTGAVHEPTSPHGAPLGNCHAAPF